MSDMNHGNGIGGGLLWIFSIFFNMAAVITKDNVSFGLGVIVSLLAIAHYIISIRKNTKNDN